MRRLLIPLTLCLLAISCVPNNDGSTFDPKDISCYDTSLWNNFMSEVRARNVMIIRTVGSNTLMVNDEEYPIDSLKDRVKLFLTNPTKNDTLPEFVSLEWEDGKEYEICKGVVSICTNCSKRKGRFYHKMLNKVNQAFDELHEQFADEYFQRPYNSLQSKEKELINMMVDDHLEMNDRFYQCDNRLLPPPMD